MQVRKSKKLWAAVLVVAMGASTALFNAMQRAEADLSTTSDLRIDEFLPATLDPGTNPDDPFSDPNLPGSTVQWGWLDPTITPKRTISSGQTIAIETMMHSHNQIVPGVTMDRIVELRLANPGGGPHTITGPVSVLEAEPGDVMELRIKRIVTKGFGANFNLPGAQFSRVGALNDIPEIFPEFQQGFVRYYFFEPDKLRTEFKPGVTLDVKPFPGVLAVGIDPNDPSPRRSDTPGVFLPASENPLAPVSTLRPWKNGSNMDLNEMQAGTRIFIPVFLPGGLIWTGDSHCRQGNGEINLTALECSYDHIVLQAIVHKRGAEDFKAADLPFDAEWPVVDTSSHWILQAHDEDMDKAFKLAAINTVKFLVDAIGLTPHEAYALTSMVGDCRITQVVDIRKGVHCMIPKKIFSQSQLPSF